MNNYISFTEKLHIQQLQAEIQHYENYHHFDASAGKRHSSFCFLSKGSVDINSLEGKLHINEGSLFFVPDGIRYQSVWRGDPIISFCSIHMISNTVLESNAICHPFQLIPELSNEDTWQLFMQICTLLSQPEEFLHQEAISLFFSFYAKAIPFLKPAEQHHYSVATLTALSFLEQHYTENISMKTLASICCVSESRLFHLFQKELNTTPVSYRNQLRIEKATQLLKTTTHTIESIASFLGFHSSTYFREVFKQHTNLSPKQYRATVNVGNSKL